jgi:hypothetical protein
MDTTTTTQDDTRAKALEQAFSMGELALIYSQINTSTDPAVMAIAARIRDAHNALLAASEDAQARAIAARYRKG